jgi:hypothetical protein
MSGTAGPADDSKRSSDNSHSAPMSPLLVEKLRGHAPAIQQRVRDVVDRKGRA